MAEGHQSVLNHPNELDPHDKDEGEHEEGANGLQRQLFHLDVNDASVLPNTRVPGYSDRLKNTLLA